MVKRFIITAIVLLAAFQTTGCSRVPAGYAGVKVYLLGGDKGVDVEELGVGRYWIGINEELHLFPTFTQNYTWTKSDGRSPDESLAFQTAEGMVVGADVGISYSINPSRVTDIFQKYRRGVEEITDTFLRNMVRDALVTEGGKLPIESVYGKGKSELMASVVDSVRNQVGPLGIDVEKIYWIGELRLPQSVTKSLNAKIEATQKAQQRENEVAQARAEADIAIEKAKGESESRLLQAKAEAEAIEIKGKALRNNPALVELMAIEKWDGVLPRMTGETIPFIQVSDSK